MTDNLKEASMRRPTLLAGLFLVPFLSGPLFACDDPPGADPATAEARGLATRLSAFYRAGDRDGAARFTAEHKEVAIVGESGGRASAKAWFDQEPPRFDARARPGGGTMLVFAGRGGGCLAVTVERGASAGDGPLVVAIPPGSFG